MRYFAWLLNIVANDDKRRLVLFRIMGVKNSSIWNSKRKTLDLHLKSNKSMDDWNFGNSRIDSVMVEIKQGILKFSGFHGWSPLVVIYDKSKVVQNFFHFWITNIRSSLDLSWRSGFFLLIQTPFLPNYQTEPTFRSNTTFTTWNSKFVSLFDQI